MYIVRVNLSSQTPMTQKKKRKCLDAKLMFAIGCHLVCAQDLCLINGKLTKQMGNSFLLDAKLKIKFNIKTNNGSIE